MFHSMWLVPYHIQMLCHNLLRLRQPIPVISILRQTQSKQDIHAPSQSSYDGTSTCLYGTDLRWFDHDARLCLWLSDYSDLTVFIKLFLYLSLSLDGDWVCLSTL